MDKFENPDIYKSQLQGPDPSKRPQKLAGRAKRIKDYQIFLDEVLGRGAFALVYVGEGIHDKKRYAVKQISNSVLLERVGEDKKKELIMRELNISQKFNHVNIVKFIDFIPTENNNYIIYEICYGGDLKQFLKDKQRLHEIVAQRFISQIAQSLRQLYLQSILHRDLKPQNFLLSEKSENAVIKLADFGLAKYYDNEEDLFSTVCGTPIYMAPEILKMNSYGEKSDLWSVGIILFELMAGFPPFQGRNKVELFQNIEKGSYQFPSEVKPSPLCVDILKKLLVSNPDYRISWKQFFEHPFINCETLTYEKIYKEMLNENNKGKKEESKAEEDKVKESKTVEKKSSTQDLQDNQKEQTGKIDLLKKADQKKQIETIKKQPNEAPAQNQASNNDSLTQEDLDEALDEVASIFSKVFKKCEQALEIIKEEVDAIQTLEPYKFEAELKFIVYRLLQDLKAIIILVFQKSFWLGINDDLTVAQYQKLSQRIQQYVSRSSHAPVTENQFILKIFSKPARQINFTPFLMEKLGEKHGMQICGYLPQSLTFLNALTVFLGDFSYVIPKIEVNKIQKELTHYALQLSQQAILAKSLFEEEKARNKYKFAQFIMEEIQRKYCFIQKRQEPNSKGGMEEKEFILDEAVSGWNQNEQVSQLQDVLNLFKKGELLDLQVPA